MKSKHPSQKICLSSYPYFTFCPSTAHHLWYCCIFHNISGQSFPCIHTFPSFCSAQFSSVQELGYIWLIETRWTAARQASLSITNSWSLLKLMSVELVMPSNHLILCHPLLLPPSIFPSIKVFHVSQFFVSGSQSIGVSASASVFPMNIQDWFPFGSTGWISLQSKGLYTVFSNTTVQKHQFFSAQPSLQSNFHIHTWLLEKP